MFLISGSWFHHPRLLRNIFDLGSHAMSAVVAISTAGSYHHFFAIVYTLSLQSLLVDFFSFHISALQFLQARIMTTQRYQLVPGEPVISAEQNLTGTVETVSKKFSQGPSTNAAQSDHSDYNSSPAASTATANTSTNDGAITPQSAINVDIEFQTQQLLVSSHASLRCENNKPLITNATLGPRATRESGHGGPQGAHGLLLLFDAGLLLPGDAI